MKRMISTCLAVLTLLSAGFGPAAAGTPPPPTLKSLSTMGVQTQLRARGQAIIAQAQRGITPITTVMSSPPTYTLGAANTNSTIQTGQATTFGSGAYQAIDTTRIEQVAGKWVSNGSTYTGAGMTGNNSTLVKRGTHGQGICTTTDAQTFDIAVNAGSSGVALYVTDLATGVRARSQAADIAPGDSLYHYLKWDFGSRGNRMLQFYGTNLTQLRGVNVETGASLWRGGCGAGIKMAVIGDSYVNGNGSGNTNSVKLTFTDFLGQRLGISDPLALGNGGTGYLNPGGTNGTYRQRLLNGDADIANIGVQDIVVLWGSVNDNEASTPAYTDAAVQAEVQATVALVMQKQPTAFIFVIGPQQTRTTTHPQSRFDAVFNGARAAANGDPRVIIIDNSPSGENWLFGTGAGLNVATYIGGGDNTHLNDAGMSYLGLRAGTSMLDALTKLLGSGPLTANDNAPGEQFRPAA